MGVLCTSTTTAVLTASLPRSLGHSQATGGKGFCWGNEQPQWMAFRDSSVGHGLLTIYNATHMKFEQKRTDDLNILDASNQVITGTYKPSLAPDVFWVTQDTSCKLGARR